MNKSDTIGNLAESLAKAQSAFPPIPKTVTVDFTSNKTGTRVKYSYAELADILDAIRKPLSENGLAISQFIASTPEGQIAIETLLAHSSGEWLSSIYTIVGKPTDPQGMGSLISYGRRYATSAIVNLATETDDDAQSAMPEGKKPKPTKRTDAPKTGLAEETNIPHQPTTESPETEHFCKKHGVKFELQSKGNNRWYSHYDKKDGWCNEKKAEAPAPKPLISSEEWAMLKEASAPFSNEQIVEILGKTIQDYIATGGSLVEATEKLKQANILL